MAFYWWADDGSLIVDPLSTHQLKNVVKVESVVSRQLANAASPAMWNIGKDHQTAVLYTSKRKFVTALMLLQVIVRGV